MNILDYNGLKRLIGLVKEALGGKADAGDVYSRSVINTILANAQEELDGKADKVREVGLDQPLYRYDVVVTFYGTPFTTEQLEHKLTQYDEDWRDYDENVAGFNAIVAGIEQGLADGSGQRIVATVTTTKNFRDALVTAGVELDSEGCYPLWTENDEQVSGGTDLYMRKQGYDVAVRCSDSSKVGDVATYVNNIHPECLSDEDDKNAINAIQTALVESETNGGTTSRASDNNGYQAFAMSDALIDALERYSADLDSEGVGSLTIEEAGEIVSSTLLLPPNTMVTLGAVDALDLALATPTAGLMNVYAVTFTCATDATTLTLPTGVNVSGTLDAPDMKSGRKFELSIYDNLCLYTYYDPE